MFLPIAVHRIGAVACCNFVLSQEYIYSKITFKCKGKRHYYTFTFKSVEQAFRLAGLALLFSLIGVGTL